MKHLITTMTAALFLVIGLTGCTSHFYQVKGELTYIYLEEPEARSVSFASSEDGYQLHQAEKIDSKTWLVTMPASTVMVILPRSISTTRFIRSIERRIPP